MDAKDVRIFCEMAFGAAGRSTVLDRHVSPSAVGKAVGLDEKTVRLRVRRMEEHGFIKHYQVVPNLSLLGLGSTAMYRFEALSLATKLRVVNHTHEMSNVLETFDYLGQSVSVNLAGVSLEDVQKFADYLSSLFELSKWQLQATPVRKCQHKMDKLDWGIVKALRYNARRSTSDLASSLSITPRMAEYRMQKLIETDAMSFRASIDPKRQTGLVFYELELAVDGKDQSQVSRQLAERYGERLLTTIMSGNIMLVNMFGFSLGEPEDAAVGTGRLPGVKSCILYILKEAIEPRSPNWIDRSIDEQLQDSIRH